MGLLPTARRPAHVLVGAGDAPAIVLAVGARGGRRGLAYLVDRVALRAAPASSRRRRSTPRRTRGSRGRPARYGEGWRPTSSSPATAADGGSHTMRPCSTRPCSRRTTCAASTAVSWTRKARTRSAVPTRSTSSPSRWPLVTTCGSRRRRWRPSLIDGAADGGADVVELGRSERRWSTTPSASSGSRAASASPPRTTRRSTRG